MKYYLLQISKYNGKEKTSETKTFGETKKTADFKNNDVWIRKISVERKFSWRKLENKSQDFYRTKKAKEFENEWLTKLYEGKLELPF